MYPNIVCYDPKKALEMLEQQKQNILNSMPTYIN